jgi:pimeloyl-ACP methyl ester carboxylesterase
MRRLVAAAAAATLAVSGLVAGLSPDPAQAHRRPGAPRPVIFVHGGSGSASQFETNAKRFAANGYPLDHIEAHDYDSTHSVESMEQIHVRLEQRIDRLLARTGADKVDVLAHSYGTLVTLTYLNSSAARAAKVAHYVHLDGSSGLGVPLPAGVPGLAIWGEGPATRSVPGARNVYFPDQAHVETVSAVPTFVTAYTFLTGRRPRTTEVVPQRHITLAGRAALFATNVGVTGATLSVHRVHPATGRRLGRPVATQVLTGDGSWGPIRADGAASYEFALDYGDQVHHQYFQPFRRSDHLVRLITSYPGTGLDLAMESSDRYASLVVLRNKEWWGDQGAAGDVLRIDGTGVLNASTSPRTKRAIALFAYDAGSDGVSHPEAGLPQFARLPFITGVDLSVRGSDPPAGVVRLVARQRGGSGRPDVVTVPNWSSANHRITVQFDDYVSRCGVRGCGPSRR